MKNVGSRLMIIILAITVTGMALVAVIGGLTASRAIHEQSIGQIGAITTRAAEDIDVWIIKHSRYVEAVANDFSHLPDIESDDVFQLLVKHYKTNDDYYSFYVGYPTGRGLFSDEWLPDYTQWNAAERDWYMGAVANPDEVYITPLYKDADTGDVCLTFSKAFSREGKIAGVVAADIMTTTLSEIVLDTDVGDESYAFLVTDDGDIMVHKNPDYTPYFDEDGDTVLHNLSEIAGGHYGILMSDEIIAGAAAQIRSVDGVKRYYACYPVETAGWILFTAIPVSIVNAPIYKLVLEEATTPIAVLIAAIIFIYFSIQRLIIRPVKDVTEAANMLARGEKVAALDGIYVGEIALLAESFRGMEAFNNQQTEWLERIADGDLSTEVRPRGENDYLGHAIVSMLSKLNDMFANINHSAHQVAVGARQIASGAQSLAQGSTAQTRAIDSLSASMIDIAEKTQRNAEIANEAANLSSLIKENAEKGTLQMNQMMQAVKEINEAGSLIRNVIKTIDDIAFQTNILALNAAVEAARAGAHGKGFSVVADEVRVLASKSAEAAKNTGSMIEDSILKANQGLDIAIETDASLRLIVEEINRSAEIAAQIAMASGDQTEALAKISDGIDQVSQVVQNVSATAEESAAASEEMSSLSDILENVIARFKLRKK